MKRLHGLQGGAVLGGEDGPLGRVRGVDLGGAAIDPGGGGGGHIHGAGIVFLPADGLLPSIFFYFEVFGEQFGDVLCGGQARRLSGFRNFLMQVEADLRAEVLCGGHVSFSFPLIARQV